MVGGRGEGGRIGGNGVLPGMVLGAQVQADGAQAARAQADGAGGADVEKPPSS